MAELTVALALIEAGARGASIALLLLFASLALRDARGSAAARYCALFALGVAASLIVWIPALVSDRAAWLAPLRVLAFGNPLVFLVLARALFDDELTLSWRAVAAWLGLVGAGFWAVYGGAAFPFLPINALSIGCVLLALGGVLADRRGDLIEARRRLRVVFVASVAGFTLAIIVSVMALRGGEGNVVFAYVNAFGALAITGFFAHALLSLTPGVLFGANAAAAVAPAPADVADPREAAVLAALRQQMETNRAYRDGGLSIAALAARLDVPEYRLRRLINQRLGHTNFSGFLNGYRLDEVCAALADPTQAEVPILTIALDAGFQSVGPFNRAFKARTGVTPSAFRAAARAGAGTKTG